MCGGPPGRYNSDNVFPFRKGYVENVAFNRANDHETLFVVVFTVVKKLHGKRVFEHVLS